MARRREVEGHIFSSLLLRAEAHHGLSLQRPLTFGPVSHVPRLQVLNVEVAHGQLSPREVPVRCSAALITLGQLLPNHDTGLVVGHQLDGADCEIEKRL